MTGRLRRPVNQAVIMAGLYLALPRPVAAETSLEYKYQDYREESDRIRVVSHSALAEADLGVSTTLRARGVIDSITGATPTGQPAPAGSDQVPLSNLEDIRHAAVAEISHAFSNSSGRLEYAYSNEHDYLSRGYTGSFVQQFNQKNTELQVGFSYVDDDVRPDFFPRPRRKLSRDFLLGLTQLLDRNTTLTVNVSYGTVSGFLSDPYKIVQKETEVAPGATLPLTFPENRPSRREKFIGYVQAIHHFENLRGSLDSSLRYFDDDHGIVSTTLELAWFQRFGQRWIVRPLFRWYRQSAADYYYADLDATPIQPVVAPDGSAPNYSSDYRLSAFDATTLGLKVVYNADDRWAFDAMFERYAMHGRDDATPDSAYASANIVTVGLKLWF